ncbi:MAG: hypothetical protein IRZ16_10580 [Myxococcaceae bacterium]|nr:hypothetical protein [Myxococcaceae bacterium]
MGVVRNLLIAAALVVGACGPAEEPGGQRTTFIALAKDFQGFEDWEPFPLPANAVDPADPHSGGPRTIYLNRRPPGGSTAFPVGTMIVKAPTGEGAEERQTFAMVKRGGTYNQAGATGWEWFELATATDGSVAIVWRGLGPPVGESYGNAGTTCNDCHKSAAANDFVKAPALQLKDLSP